MERPSLELEIVNVEITRPVARHVDDPRRRARPKDVHEIAHHPDIPHDVGRELQLEALGSLDAAPRRRRRIVDDHVQRPSPAPCERRDAGRRGQIGKLVADRVVRRPLAHAPQALPGAALIATQQHHLVMGRAGDARRDCLADSAARAGDERHAPSRGSAHGSSRLSARDLGIWASAGTGRSAHRSRNDRTRPRGCARSRPPPTPRQARGCACAGPWHRDRRR